MTPDQCADLLIDWLGGADFEQRARLLAPELTLEVIAALKKRADALLHSHPERSLQIAQAARLAAVITGMPAAQALAQWMLGNGYSLTNQYEPAIQSYGEALQFYSSHGFVLETARLQSNLASVHLNRGEYQDALRLAQPAKDALERAGGAVGPFLQAVEMNLGVAYKGLGQFPEALAAYERGRALCVGMGHAAGAARFDLNRANVLELMDRIQEATRLYQDVRQTLEQYGYHADVARADMNLGLLAWHSGEYRQALRYLEAAYQSFAAVPDPVELAVVNLYRSFVYLNLNFLEEAIDLGAQAERKLRQHKLRAYRAMALENIGLAYQRLEMYATAEQKLTLARNIFRRQRARAWASLVDLRLAQLALMAGDIERAGALGRALEPKIDPFTWPGRAAQLQLLLAQQALHGQNTSEAERRIQAALSLAEQYDLPEATPAAYLAGQVCERAGDEAGALAYYEQALRKVERDKALLALDEFQIGYLDDKLPIYQAAASVYRRGGQWASMLYLLNLAQLAPLPKVDAPSVGSPRLRELRSAWKRVQSQLENWDDPRSQPAAPKEILALQKQRRKLELQIADLIYQHPTEVANAPAFGDGSSLAAVEDFAARLQAGLRPGEAILHYFILSETLQAALVLPGTIRPAVDLISEAKMERLRNAWRYSLEHSAQPAPLTGGNPLPYLKRMYQALIAPLEVDLAGCDHLFVSLPAAFHDLPLAALYDGSRYLVERFRLTQLSAPGARLHVDARPPAEREGERLAVIVGNSDHGRLPYAAVEAAQVAETLGPAWMRLVLIDTDATTERVRQASQVCHLLHVATHAVFRADNPLFSWMRLADGDLTVHELSDLSLLKAPLVILSACETGRGRPRGGGLQGMGRALLAAGASGLVVSLWKLNDASAAGWMANFYRELAQSPAEALCLAQRQALAEGQSPYLWGGYIYIGG